MPFLIFLAIVYIVAGIFTYKYNKEFINQNNSKIKAILYILGYPLYWTYKLIFT